jgi:hypothetical protein
MIKGKYFSEEIQSQIRQIIDLKDYIFCLHKRLFLMREGFALKTQYEKNEVAILEFETVFKIYRFVEKLDSAEKKLFESLKEFYSDIQEVNKYWDAVIEMAKIKQHDNLALKHFLYNINWKLINERTDEKIRLFKEIKKQILELE